MQRTHSKLNLGFTLIEVTVTVVIFGLLIYGITMLISGILTNSNAQSKLLDNNDQARKVSANFTNEIRNAVTSANGSYPLEIVSAQQIAFYTLSGATVIRVRYYLSAGKLYRAVTSPSGSPPIYNLGTEVASLVQGAMATQVGDTIFSYYDGNFTGSGAALVQPVNPTLVKYVQINLKLYKQGSRNNTGIYNVTAGGSVRNLKTNL